MPSDDLLDAHQGISGRCYCGAQAFQGPPPQIVAYCHCTDCRRVTGAPVAAFAACAEGSVTFEPALGAPVSVHAGVKRWFCQSCGSPLAATYAYLPDQIYIPLGLVDQADTLPPSLHAHSDSGLCWLHIDDDLPRLPASSRAVLQLAGRV